MSIRTNKKKSFRNIGFRQILKYRLPLPGIASILHRISGAVLFLMLPFILLMFQYSLRSKADFIILKAWMACFPIKCWILATTSAMVFHFFAGLRYLGMDLHYGVNKVAGRRSAAGVLILSGLISLAFAAKLFGVF